MALAIDVPAPDFTLVDENNEPWTLSEHRGRNVVLVFFPMAFSPTCTQELKGLAATADRYDAAGAEVVGISVDQRWALHAFKEHEGLQATLLADCEPKGEVARLYDAWWEPRGFANRVTYVIDKDGVIRQAVETNPADARNADEYLEALAACPV